MFLSIKKNINNILLSTKLSTKITKPCKSKDYRAFCGERGIRTPGPVTVNSFQDCRNRPLCHFSSMLHLRFRIAVANIVTFFVF